MNKKLEDCNIIVVEGKEYVSLEEAQQVLYQATSEGIDQALESINDAFSNLTKSINKL